MGARDPILSTWGYTHSFLPHRIRLKKSSKSIRAKECSKNKSRGHSRGQPSEQAERRVERAAEDKGKPGEGLFESC